MSEKASPDPMGSMWDWSAHDVRFYRTRARMTGAELGRLIGADRAVVSKIETGARKLNDKQAGAIDKHFNTGGHFLRLVHYARLGHSPDWFKEHVGYEARAESLRIFELALIPGLLQIEAYARACFQGAGMDDVDQEVAKRMARQEALERSPRPLLWVLLSQSVLTWPVGGLAVMREQLGHLVSISRQPYCSIRIVPPSAGAYVGLDGAFKIITVAEGDVAYTEAHGGGRLVVSTAEVRAFRTRYDRIGAHALPEDSSRSLIEQAMEAMR